MTLQRTCALGCLAMLVAACGGSGSETPPPIEPTSPGAVPDEEPAQPATTTESTTGNGDDTGPLESVDQDPEVPEEDAD